MWLNFSRQPRDTQHILVQEKDSAFGIDCPMNCFESTNSLNSIITTTTTSSDPETPSSVYISEVRRKKFKTDNISSPTAVYPVQQRYTSAIMKVDSYDRTTGPNLPTVSETVPVYYSCSQVSASSSNSATNTNESWNLPDSNFQRRNSRRSIMKFSLSEKIEEVDDASIHANESSPASSDSEDVAMASDSTCSSTENAMSATGFHPKHVSFLEDLSTSSSPLETRPRIQIRLMRVKAASVSDLSVTNQSISSQETDLVSSTDNILTDFQNNNNENNSNTSCSDSTIKRSGYLKKIKTLFRPKSSKSLSKFMSASSEQINIDPTSKPTRLRSSSFSPISSLDNLSNDIDEPKTKQTLSTGKQTNQFNGFTASASKNDSKISLNKVPSASRLSAKGSDEIVPGDGVLRLNRVNSGPEIERNYSLLRSTSRDSATVSFPRIPSLRKRRSHIRLLHHFATTLPVEESTSESHAVKEATNIQVLKGGEAVVTDVLSNKLFLFDNKGYPKVTFAVESGSEPWATCVTPEGALAVTLKRQGCVSLWSTSGEPIAEFGQPDLTAPTGIQCDTKGRFIVADEEANSVCVFNRYGRFLSELSAPMKENQEPSIPFQSHMLSFTGTFFNHPRYICITRDGHYVISDSANHCIKIFDPVLNFKFQFGSFGKLDGQFKFPYGVAADDAGFLYVADHYNNRVSMFNKDGHFMEHVLTSADGITRPSSIAAVNSLLYVTHGDLRSNKISVFQMLKDHSNFV
ncbi:hypothetical protein Btru_075988 [Bulinus truncatus]|nr:hypothetical protein Btru_075988 [Bulinus truncatus]